MIGCNLTAQSGNQLFTIATLAALAWDNNDTFKIPSISTSRQNGVNYTWPVHFKYIPRLTPEDEATLTSFYREPKFSYNPIPYQPNLKIHGYFQSEKYFAHRRPQILDLFIREFITTSPMDNTVAVQVRRGDYLKSNNAKFLTPSVEYIQAAMALFPNCRFVFFSDDPHWCKTNFPHHDYSEGRSAFDDLALMSSCEHHIISASTFGFWGAWLGQHATQKVIAPAQWFGPKGSHLETKDIVPERWVRI